MILLDANAMLSVLWNEVGADEVAELLRDGDCAILSPCLSEVVDQLIRCGGNSPASLGEKLAPLLDEVVAVLAVDASIAWRAGELRAAHYNRKTTDLSLADCLLLASAGPSDEIATSDRAVVATAEDLGIGVIPLPDSNGKRPAV